MTRPGLQIFSDEWFKTYGTKVPEKLMPVVKEICTSFELGNTWMPNNIAKILMRYFKASDLREINEHSRRGDEPSEIASKKPT